MINIIIHYLNLSAYVQNLKMISIVINEDAHWRPWLYFAWAHSTMTNWMKRLGPFIEQGWGLLSRFPPFRYFPNFSALSKHTLDIEYHVYIWQVSPQLSCGDTCQIWKWFNECNKYFWKIENFANGEINERSFSNPHPWTGIIINSDHQRGAIINIVLLHQWLWTMHTEIVINCLCN